MGRRGVRPELGPALRQRERDGVDGEAGRAQDAGRRADDRQGALPAVLRGVPSRRPAAARRRSSRRSSTSAARRSVDEIDEIVREGGGRMPAHAELHSAVRRAIVEYVVERDVDDGPRRRARRRSTCRYSLDGYIRFTDPDGFPAITPPWGTLTAIDLNKRGDRLAGAARRDAGLRADEHGQRELRRPGRDRRRPRCSSARPTTTRSSAPSTRTPGKVLWETTLPAAGNATPAVYEVNGKQFVVIARRRRQVGRAVRRQLRRVRAALSRATVPVRMVASG